MALLTAYEIKTLYGRVAATAEKKAKGLFTYGLCKLFSLMIVHEEKMFLESFAQAIGLQKPEYHYQKNTKMIQKHFKLQWKSTRKQFMKFTQQRDESISATLESGEMPPGVVGLIPDGSTKVSWRWMGEVFEDGTDDILNNSIVVRNLQELGVDSIEALKYLFPNKTDEERAAMLSGYPFRMVQQTQQSLNSFIGLLSNLYQLPHPQTPELPLASDPNLDITGFLYRSLEFLRKELSYSGSYKPSDSGTSPDKLSDADERRTRIGLPIRDESAPNIAGISGPGINPTNSGLPGTGPGPAAFGTSGQSMAGGIPGPQRKFEYKQPSQTQVPYSAYQTPTPQANPQANWASAPQVMSAPSEAPIYSPQVSTQTYSTAQAPMQMQPQAQEAVSDGYLSQISDESLEVLEHFGAEAPCC